MIKAASASTKISVRQGTLEVTEPRGIGGVTVLRPKSGWATLKIRLRRTTKQGLNSVEGITIITSSAQGRGFFKEKPQFRWTGDNPVLRTPWFSHENVLAISRTHFRASRTPQGLMFTFGEEFLGDTPTLRFNWVDYYRN